jgi:N-acetylmuramoyl-L-alanine amidase
MASVLVETGFLSNTEEEKYLKSTAGQNTLALALYNAFAAYKREHDKYRNIISRSNQEPIKPANRQQSYTQTSKVYKIQILASKTRFSPNSKQLKGYKDVEVLEANGYFRYLYGRSTDYAAIQELHRKVSKDFKDAFIVSFTTTTSASSSKK